MALWRKGLLAQAILRGRTAGYHHHPQLARFAEQGDAVACLAEYLRAVRREALRRDYAFAESKISSRRWTGRVLVTRGQLQYEWQHLRRKLAARDPDGLRALSRVTRPRAHPLFRVVPGPVADWERIP